MGHMISQGNSPFEQARRQGTTKVSTRLRDHIGDRLECNMAGLTPRESELLVRILSKPVDYMDSKELHQPDAEHLLFDESVEVPIPNISWYDPVMSELGIQGDGGRGRNRRRGEVMRLSSKQERALFYRFNYARYRARLIQDALGVQPGIPPSRPATTEEVDGLLYWGELANSLREQIAETNVGLVLAMVRRTNLKNVDVADLVSEGNMALLRAIDKFNPDYGFKFSTYACQSILKAFSRLAHKESRLRERFPMEFDPEMEESGWLGTRRRSFEEDCAAEVADIVRTNRCHLSQVELRVVRHRFGLDVFDESKREKLEDKQDISPYPPTRAQRRKMTLGEVGQMIGVGKERVRQIQVKALNKIRNELEAGFLTRHGHHLEDIDPLISNSN